MKLVTKIGLIAAGISTVLGILGIALGLLMGGNLRTFGFNSVQQEIREEAPEITVEEEWEKFSETTVEEEWEEFPEDAEEKETVEGADNRKQDLLHHGVEYEHHSSDHMYGESQYHDRFHNPQLYNYGCTLQEIDSLKVDAKGAKITIYIAEEGENFTYYSNRSADICSRKGTMLMIADDAYDDTLELELYLPEKVFKEIQIVAAAAEITASKMAADTISIYVDTAEVWVDEIRVTQGADIQIGAGALQVGYYSGPKLEAECSMGSMEITCDGAKEEYNYVAKCDMGAIQIGEKEYSGLGNAVTLDHGSSKVIEADCGMGEIVFKFSE